jgi:hypothetical protein
VLPKCGCTQGRAPFTEPFATRSASHSILSANHNSSGDQTRRFEFELFGRAVENRFGRPAFAWRMAVVASTSLVTACLRSLTAIWDQDLAVRSLTHTGVMLGAPEWSLASVSRDNYFNSQGSVAATVGGTVCHFQASNAFANIASPFVDFSNTSFAMRLSLSSSGKSNQARVCIRSRLCAAS